MEFFQYAIFKNGHKHCTVAFHPDLTLWEATPVISGTPLVYFEIGMATVDHKANPLLIVTDKGAPHQPLSALMQNFTYMIVTTKEGKLVPILSSTLDNPMYSFPTFKHGRIHSIGSGAAIRHGTSTGMDAVYRDTVVVLRASRSSPHIDDAGDAILVQNMLIGPMDPSGK